MAACFCNHSVAQSLWVTLLALGGKQTPVSEIAMESQYPPSSAILEENIEMIRSCLTVAGQANIDDCCYESEQYGLCSSLMAASEWGRREVVRLLLEEGAEAGLKSSSGWSALVIASGEGHLEVAKELLSCGQIQDLPTALVVASENGHCEIIELLINEGAEANVLDDKGRCALVCASSKEHFNATRLLLDRGAFVDHQDGVGCTALIAASNKGCYELAELLLERGARHFLLNIGGWSALFYASSKGHCEVVQLLLDKGDLVDFQDKKGRSALMLASQKGTVKLLNS